MIWPLRAAGCMAAPEPSRLGTMRVVIADAGPLIGLARIGCLDLLRALFGGVTITAVVAAEIGIDAEPDVRADRRPGASAIAKAREAGWLSIVESKQQQLIPACAPLMAALREEGCYLSDGLVAAVLAEVAEA